jgi:hypothetical protein
MVVSSNYCGREYKERKPAEMQRLQHYVVLVRYSAQKITDLNGAERKIDNVSKLYLRDKAL